MITTNCPFAHAIALPTLEDAGFAALQSGELLAVEAIARLMQRQASDKSGFVGEDAIALLEDVFGGVR